MVAPSFRCFWVMMLVEKVWKTSSKVTRCFTADFRRPLVKFKLPHQGLSWNSSRRQPEFDSIGQKSYMAGEKAGLYEVLNCYKKNVAIKIKI